MISVHPSVRPVPSNSRFALVVEMLSRWTPEGHCGCLVTQMYRPIRTIKTPHQNSKFMPHPPKKMSLPAHQNFKPRFARPAASPPIEPPSVSALQSPFGGFLSHQTIRILVTIFCSPPSFIASLRRL